MQTFLSSVQGVLTIVFMLALGYYLAKAGWFDSSISDLFAKLVVNISLPLSMIVNITSTFSKKQLERPGRGLLIPFLSILLSYLIAYILAEIFKEKEEEREYLQQYFHYQIQYLWGFQCLKLFLGKLRHLILFCTTWQILQFGGH